MQEIETLKQQTIMLSFIADTPKHLDPKNNQHNQHKISSRYTSHLLESKQSDMLVEEESSIGMKFYAQNPPRMFVAPALPQTSCQGSQTDFDIDDLLVQILFYQSNLE
jgi:hypothetical protein